MATTITISDATRRRLADYKFADMTYDEALNLLMDRVPLEDVAAEQLREHYRRLATFRSLPASRSREKLQASGTIPKRRAKKRALRRARRPSR